MSFHNEQFPEGISYGSKGGPGFNTGITELRSGAEVRNQRWSLPRHRYNAKYGVKSIGHFNELRNFYWGRSGSAYSFRYKDFADFTTASDDTSAPATSDQVIGTGDGVTTQFQLVKTYGDASFTVDCPIVLPREGTVVAAIDEVATTAFTFNTTTGIITFNSAPGDTLEITVGFEFDRPCRFGKGIDDVFDLDYVGFKAGNLPDIPIIEVIDETEVNDSFYPGGAKNHGTLTDDYTLSLTEGRVQEFVVATSGLVLIVPDTSNLPVGGPYFYLHNSGTDDIEVETSAGASLITLLVNDTVTILLGYDSVGAKTWYALG